MNITLTKTDFLKYLSCDKSLWLQKNKPFSYIVPKKSIYEEKLSYEGYKVQNELQKHLNNKPDAKQYSFEISYETAECVGSGMERGHASACRGNPPTL